MDDLFNLPVVYKGEELTFPVKLVPMGYTYRLIVFVQDTEIFFERDEEGLLRALLPPHSDPSKKPPDSDLVAAIGAMLAAL